jgi:signal transduction histidine kinase
MNIGNLLMAVVLLLSAAVLFVHSASAEKSSGMADAPKNLSTNEAKLISFVESAVTYVHENGRDKALKEFSNNTGSFVRGDLYIYAYDFNGTNLAQPFWPDRIGKNMLNESDPNGVLFIRNLIDLARDGKGLTYFVFANPANNNKSELKIGYVMKVDDDWWLGSGMYLSDINASFDQKQRDALVAYVSEALQFARENGEVKSLAVFNDPRGNFTRGVNYIFALDYEGKTLALPFQPELLGVNRIDTQDPKGVYFTKLFISTARRNNGFLYYMYPDPSINMTPRLKLSYIANVDGNWCLGSGIYAMAGKEID